MWRSCANVVQAEASATFLIPGDAGECEQEDPKEQINLLKAGDKN